MSMKSYYSEPTMVKFNYPSISEEDEMEEIYGIAFGESIICSCCGGVFSTVEVIAEAEEEGFELNYEEFDWVPFNYLMA